MNNVMNKLTYGLFVLGVRCYKKDNACIVNTVVQVASAPDTITVSVSKSNHTADMLQYADDFTVSVISEDADYSLFTHFGFRSGRDCEKFDDFPDKVRASNGVFAVTKGTNAYICAHVINRIDLGSHFLFIAKVTDSVILSETPSASYGYYHAHIKPQPKQEEKNGKTVYRCKICGYEYEGDSLPDDYVCPICKHGKDDFEKV